MHAPPSTPRSAPLVVAATLLAITGAGCRFGDARFDSTVSGRTFDPSGTVFSYIDGTDDNLVAESGDNPRVVVAMTWIVFDPNSDLNDLDGTTLADDSHELKLRDALALVFDHQGDLKTGAAFKSIVLGGDEQGAGKLLTKLHLAPERITAASTYGDVHPFASQRTTDVTITSVDFTIAQPVIAADITVTFARTDTDAGDAREGAFTGSFEAPVAQERAAEQNLALLDVSDVLGLPLAPRPVAP